jgi:hypothetical protein
MSRHVYLSGPQSLLPLRYAKSTHASGPSVRSERSQSTGDQPLRQAAPSATTIQAKPRRLVSASSRKARPITAAKITLVSRSAEIGPGPRAKADTTAPWPDEGGATARQRLFLRDFGPTGVFLFVAACMGVVIFSVAELGPRTRRLEVEAIAH